MTLMRISSSVFILQMKNLKSKAIACSAAQEPS